MRLRYWDIAKGITIILVILGHIESVDPYVRKIIFTYHMPFFFIANAYFIKNYNIKENIIKSAKSLLIPYALVAGISAMLSVTYNATGLPNYVVFAKRITDMFMGFSYISNGFVGFESVWLIWFVVCLFVARILYIVLMKCLENLSEWVSFVLVCIISFAGMQIGLQGYYLPWSLDVAMVAFVFMWIGDFLHKKDILEHKRILLLYVACFIVWATLGFGDFQIELAIRRYPGQILSVIEAIAGSIVFIGIARFIEKYLSRIAPFIEWCGKNSMIILALHCLEMRFFNLPFEGDWKVTFLLEFVVMIVCTWFILQIQKGINYLNNIEK